MIELKLAKFIFDAQIYVMHLLIKENSVFYVWM